MPDGLDLTPRTGVRIDRPELAPLAAGQLMRAGLPVIDSKATQMIQNYQELYAERGKMYSDMTMRDVCAEVLRLQGHHPPRDPGELVRAATSTSALSYVFTNAVNAQLLQAYKDMPDSTEGWVREADVENFKEAERARLTKAGSLTRLPRGGTAEHTAVGEAQATYKIARYAKTFQVDEQDIIDDRFDMLLQVPIEMAAAARRLRPDLVYSLLLSNPTMADGIALFDSNHGNLGEAGTALAAATLQAGIVAMAAQTEDGVGLNLKAAFLIVPPDLLFTAKTLLESAERVSSEGTFNPLRDENIVLRSDNRLGTSGVTDPASGTTYAGSATNWFLAASPLLAPTIEVGYLRGTNREPQVRGYELNQGRWGLGWDVHLDIGACVLDHRGLYKATGES